MTSNNSSEIPVGVIGAGNFGTVIANMLAQNRKVLLYARNLADVHRINSTRKHRGYRVHDQVEAVNDFERIGRECEVIFPMVPSSHFREMMVRLAPHLHPYHMLIHGTKGFDITLPAGETIESINKLDRSMVKTMSEVIREESVAVRIGCLAGPNLSKELALGQPAATVVASSFHEVIQTGKKLLKSERFQVYENNDIVGVEIAGVLKNIIAIASGALNGLGFGDNAKGLLISRGAVEMVYLGRALGGDTKSFLGVAGIGDLVTTCNSPMSRNFTVGYRLAKGEKLKDIIEDMKEVVEGLTVEEALEFLMRYPLNMDIDFI